MTDVNSPAPAMTPAPMPAKKGGPSKIVIGCLAAVGVAVLLFIGFIVVIFSVVMGATAAPVAAADAFFATASSRGAAAAYATAAPSYQAATSEPDFETVAAAAKLSAVDKASWNSRNISNDTSNLSGSLHYKDGGEKPVSVTLQKLGADWKVTGIDVSGGG